MTDQIKGQIPEETLVKVQIKASLFSESESVEERKKRLNREANERYINNKQNNLKTITPGLAGETPEETAERLKFAQGETAEHRKQGLNLEAVERYHAKNRRELKGEGKGYVDNETYEKRKKRLDFIQGESFQHRQRRLSNLRAKRFNEKNPDRVKENQLNYLASSAFLLVFFY